MPAWLQSLLQFLLQVLRAVYTSTIDAFNVSGKLSSDSSGGVVGTITGNDVVTTVQPGGTTTQDTEAVVIDPSVLIVDNSPHPHKWDISPDGQHITREP